MNKLMHRVYSVREYRSGAEDVLDTHVRVDLVLVMPGGEVELDSSVFTMKVFSAVHPILQANVTETLLYDFTVYTEHLARIKAELQRMMGGNWQDGNHYETKEG